MVRWWSLPGGLEASAGALARRFELQAICITRGAEGAALWKTGAWWTHPGYTTTVADTVGAGDAFLAGLLYGWLGGEAEEALLGFANMLGAFVASRQGATPSYTIAEVEAVQARRATAPGKDQP
jgi:fructokinase